MSLTLTLYTVGHGDRTLDELLELLKQNGVEILVDVRARSADEEHPNFHRDHLRHACERSGLEYHWAGHHLGGRRRARAGSRHTAIIDERLRGFADFMDTEDFKIGLRQLFGLNEHGVTALLCVERYPQKCHRAMIADALLLKGVSVVHLIDDHESVVHRLHENLRRDAVEPVYDRNSQDKFLH